MDYRTPKIELIPLLKRFHVAFGPGAGTLDDQLDVWHATFGGYPLVAIERGIQECIDTWTETKRPRPGDVKKFIGQARLAMNPERKRFDPDWCPHCRHKYFYAGSMRHDGTVQPRRRCLCAHHDQDPAFRHPAALAWVETDQSLIAAGMVPPDSWEPPAPLDVAGG